MTRLNAVVVCRHLHEHSVACSCIHELFSSSAGIAQKIVLYTYFGHSIPVC